MKIKSTLKHYCNCIGCKDGFSDFDVYFKENASDISSVVAYLSVAVFYATKYCGISCRNIFEYAFIYNRV